MGCGYIYVVSHPDMGKGERKIAGSCHHPFDVAQRWERLERTGPVPLRLHSMAFVSDVTETRAALQDTADRMRAAKPGRMPGGRGRVSRDHVASALRTAVNDDRKRLEASFDRHTRLFLDPAQELTGPPARLAREIAERLKPHCHPHTADLFRAPYAIGLLWSLIELRAHQLQVPMLYVPETYRTLAAKLWGVRPCNAEMRDILATIRRAPSELRLGRFAFNRFLRGPLSRDAHAPQAYEVLEDFVRDPQAHMAQTYDLYARTHYGTLTLGLMGTLATGLKAGVIIALLFLADMALLGGGAEAMIRVLSVGFLGGLLLLGLNFFQTGDLARAAGLIGHHDWYTGRRRLDQANRSPLQV